MTEQFNAVKDVDQALTLGKATHRACEGLGLSGRALADTVGFSEPTVSRIRHGARGIDPNSKQGQLSLMLVRLYRSLDALVGGDDAKRRTWMHSHNSALNGTPAALILHPEGLARTLTYLDGIRASI